MPKCEHCPCPDFCIGDHPDFGFLCRNAATGDPIHLAHVVARSRIGPNPAPAPEKPAPGHRPLDIPLAGDVVEAIAKLIGGDKLARWWEAKTGVCCGCADRKEAMNRASAEILEWLGIEAKTSGEASAPAALAPPRLEGLANPDHQPHGDE